MSLAGEQALYLKDIVKSRRARRGRARFALLAQIGELAMLHCAKELAYEHIYIYIGKGTGYKRTQSTGKLAFIIKHTYNLRGGEWHLEKRGSRTILEGSRNLGSVFDKPRSLVFSWFVFTFFSLENFHQRVSVSDF